MAKKKEGSGTTGFVGREKGKGGRLGGVWRGRWLGGRRRTGGGGERWRGLVRDWGSGTTGFVGRGKEKDRGRGRKGAGDGSWRR